MKLYYLFFSNPVINIFFDHSLFLIHIILFVVHIFILQQSLYSALYLSNHSWLFLLIRKDILHYLFLQLTVLFKWGRLSGIRGFVDFALDYAVDLDQVDRKVLVETDVRVTHQVHFQFLLQKIRRQS